MFRYLPLVLMVSLLYGCGQAPEPASIDAESAMRLARRDSGEGGGVSAGNGAVNASGLKNFLLVSIGVDLGCRATVQDPLSGYGEAKDEDDVSEVEEPEFGENSMSLNRSKNCKKNESGNSSESSSSADANATINGDGSLKITVKAKSSGKASATHGQWAKVNLEARKTMGTDISVSFMSSVPFTMEGKPTRELKEKIFKTKPVYHRQFSSADWSLVNQQTGVVASQDKEVPKCLPPGSYVFSVSTRNEVWVQSKVAIIGSKPTELNASGEAGGKVDANVTFRPSANPADCGQIRRKD